MKMITFSICIKEQCHKHIFFNTVGRFHVDSNKKNSGPHAFSLWDTRDINQAIINFVISKFLQLSFCSPFYLIFLPHLLFFINSLFVFISFRECINLEGVKKNDLVTKSLSQTVVSSSVMCSIKSLTVLFFHAGRVHGA